MPNNEKIISKLASIVAVGSQAVVFVSAILVVIGSFGGVLEKWVDSLVASRVNVGLESLQGAVAELKQETANLEQYTVRAGTISYFASEDCPDHWTRALELTGRYVVAVSQAQKEHVGSGVGIPLTHGENRSAGRHTHSTKVRKLDCSRESPDPFKPGGDCSYHDDDAIESNHGNNLEAGTNAPYILLTACRKN